MAYERELTRLLQNAPDYLNTLLSIDYLHCRVYDDPAVPALAYTQWDADHKRWMVTFNPLVDEASDEAQGVLWRHEVGHIAFAHFGKQVCTPDDPIRARAEQLEVGDIQVNTYLLPDKRFLDEIGKLNHKFANERGLPISEDNKGYLDPEEILPEIGLNVQEYPYEVIHAYLHQFNDDQAKAQGKSSNWTQDMMQGMCGGVQGDVPEEGTSGYAAAAVIGQVTAEGEEAITGRQFGNSSANASLMLRDYELPEWITPLEAFARATVDTILTDRRSHRRPAEIYQPAGIHMPTYRPSWAPKPETVIFLVDTSGSMSDQLKYVMPTLQYLQQNGVTVRLIAGDTHVSMDEEFKPSTPLPERVIGGGGTEITPLFDRAKDYEPKALVAFTDGYVPRWPKDPEVPVLVVGCETEAPSWATKA